MSRVTAESLDPSTLGPHSAIISICDRETNPANIPDGFGHVLRCFFKFVDGSFRRIGDGGPTDAQSREIAEFLHMLHSAPEEYALIVHCGEGMYRSVAVCCFCEFEFDADSIHTNKEVRDPMGSVSLWKDIANAFDDLGRAA